MFIASEVKAYMAKLKMIRYDHNKAIIDALRAIGIDIDYVDLDKQAKKNTITRLNFARILVQNMMLGVLYHWHTPHSMDLTILRQKV